MATHRNVLCALLALAAPSSLVCQDTVARATFVGSVSSGNGMPVVGARVTLPELQRGATANATGDFRISDLPAGRHQIQIRYIGYKPLDIELRFAAGETVTRDFTLDAQPATLLPEVPITGKADPYTGKLVEFESRRLAGFGRFITREQLETQEHRRLSDVVRTLPGTTLLRLRSGAMVLATGRGALSIEKDHLGGDPGRGDPRRCYSQIFVDGLRIHVSTPGLSPPNLDDFLVNTLAGIEFYPGPATTPTALNMTGAACGTLVLWTREK